MDRKWLTHLAATLILWLLPFTALAASFKNPLGNKFNATPGNAAAGIQAAILELVNFMLNITVALALGGIVWGGILLIFPLGKDKAITQGKTIITWSIIGLIVIIMAQIMLRFVGRLLGVVEGT